MRATVLLGWFFYLAAASGFWGFYENPTRQDFQMQPACETARAELKRTFWVSEKCIFDGVPRWDWKGEKK